MTKRKTTRPDTRCNEEQPAMEQSEKLNRQRTGTLDSNISMVDDGVDETHSVAGSHHGNEEKTQEDENYVRMDNEADYKQQQVEVTTTTTTGDESSPVAAHHTPRLSKGNSCSSIRTHTPPPSQHVMRGRPRLTQLESLSVQLDISEILDFLFLGAKAVSEDGEALRNLGVGHIVNCTLEAPNHFEEMGMKYLKVSVDDKVTADISPYFKTASEFIEEARQNKSKVLVHCTMGMSRSSTIVIAYLMQFHGMDLATAMQLTKEKRAMVSPNSGFMQQLLEFEQQLFGAHTIDLERYKKSRFGDVESFRLI